MRFLLLHRTGLASLLCGILMTMAFVACKKPSESGATDGGDTLARSAGTTIQGQARLEGQERHAGIQVYLGRSSYSSRTDSAGNYKIAGVAPGKYELLAERLGFKDKLVTTLDIDDSIPTLQVTTFTLAADTPSTATASVNVSVKTAAPEPAASVEGLVTLMDGVTPDGVRVEIEGAGLTASTNAKGEYSFPRVQPGAYQLLINKPGYTPVAAPLNVQPGETNRQPAYPLMPLAAEGPTETITGKVAMFGPGDKLAAEFDKVTVTIDPLKRTAKLNEGGEFVFAQVPPGRYTISAAAENYTLDAPVTIELPSPAPAQANLSLRAAAGLELGGIVGSMTREGAGSHAGIVIALAGTQYSATTNAQGLFAFETIRAAKYTVLAKYDGYAPLEIENVIVEPGKITDLGALTLKKETNPPKVVSVAPADAATKVEVIEKVPVLIRFNQSMDRKTMKEAFRIDPPVDFTLFAGNEHPSSDEHTLCAELSATSNGARVQFETLYRVSIAASAANIEGVPMEKPYEFRFTTGGPRIIRTDPPEGGEGLGANPFSQVVFFVNDRIDVSGILDRDIRLRPATSGAPIFDVSIDPATGWSRIQIRAGWQPDTRYSITLDRRVETLSKMRLENTPFTLNFRTAPNISLTAPQQGSRR